MCVIECYMQLNVLVIQNGSDFHLYLLFGYLTFVIHFESYPFITGIFIWLTECLIIIIYGEYERIYYWNLINVLCKPIKTEHNKTIYINIGFLWYW